MSHITDKMFTRTDSTVSSMFNVIVKKARVSVDDDVIFDLIYLCCFQWTLFTVHVTFVS